MSRWQRRPGAPATNLTDIVAGVYCEQRMMFDADRGGARPEHVRKRAAAGIRAHERFEHEAASGDSRCFIASAVYGPDAWQTNALRQYRDRRLKPTIVGRILISIYYRMSPPLAQHLRTKPATSVTRRAARRLVDALLKRLTTQRSR